MTRDDLYGYYRRYYVPNNATLVDRRRRRRRRCAATRRAPLRRSIPAGADPARHADRSSPSRPASGASTIRKEGTTAYLKVGYHAPAVADPTFFPVLRARRRADRRQGHEPVVAASACRRRSGSARLYRALVETRARLAVSGGDAADRRAVSLHGVGDGHRRDAARRGRGAPLLEELEACAQRGRHRRRSSQRAKAQLQARLVFDDDSVTNIAHQLGYFETIAGARHRSRRCRQRIAAVDASTQVRRGGARLFRADRTGRSAGSSRWHRTSTPTGEVRP